MTPEHWEKPPMEKLAVAQARKPDAIGREVLLRGWVRTRRDSKAGFSFLELNDGSSMGNIQVIADGSLENYESQIKHLSPGSSVSVEEPVKPPAPAAPSGSP